jgi:hypothetical protein
VPRRLPADAAGRPFGAARNAAARRPARRHLRRRRGGELTIVEVKSSVEDWRVDVKVARLSRLVRPALLRRAGRFPAAADPEEIGLIVADAYGGEILRHPPRRPLAAARRKSLLIDCARLAAERLARLEDPDFVDFA